MASAAERLKVLEELEDWLRLPMASLSLIWLVIVIAELLWGEFDLLSTFGVIIWVIFIAEFSVRLIVAPEKWLFLRRNWLTILALAVPALRMFRGLRVMRAARALRGARLVRIVGTANRSMKALQTTLRRRHFGYVAGLTGLIIVLGAAGMLSFEPASEVQGGFNSYSHALWWTAMLVTSIGADFWPVTTEGRILTLLLSIYGLAVFGYITASFASFFVGRDGEQSQSALEAADLKALTNEITELRHAVNSLRRSSGAD